MDPQTQRRHFEHLEIHGNTVQLSPPSWPELGQELRHSLVTAHQLFQVLQKLPSPNGDPLRPPSVAAGQAMTARTIVPAMLTTHARPNQRDNYEVSSRVKTFFTRKHAPAAYFLERAGRDHATLAEQAMVQPIVEVLQNFEPAQLYERAVICAVAKAMPRGAYLVSQVWAALQASEAFVAAAAALHAEDVASVAGEA